MSITSVQLTRHVTHSFKHKHSLWHPKFHIKIYIYTSGSVSNTKNKRYVQSQSAKEKYIEKNTLLVLGTQN